MGLALAVISLAVFVPHLATQAQLPTEKIILDTDIGDDIDDAYALAMLAKQPNVRLLGVVTAFGETGKRAQIAAKLLHIAGRDDVPVYAGRPGDHKIGRQYDWASMYTSSQIQSGSAVDFMRDQILQSPGEVTLVAIGPLVNLGDLLTRYPELESKIKRIVIMGGAVYVGYNNQPPAGPEWNIKCDPLAARAVFGSGVPIVMAGLEVTTMMQLDDERQRHVYAYGTPCTDALAALTALWGGKVPTLFDPVAAAYACGHVFADTSQVHVQVQDDGLTKAVDGAPNVTVLVHPRKDEFLDWYVSALKP